MIKKKALVVRKCKCGHPSSEHGETGRGPCGHVTDPEMFVVCRCVKYRKRKDPP